MQQLQGKNMQKRIAVLTGGAVRHFVFALCAGILSASSAHADVVIKQQNEKLYFAHIIDTITMSDYEALVEKVAAIHGATIAYALNSGGGGVEAALKIGRFLRQKNALALVQEGDICISSCMLVLAGAAHRDIKGIVGVQRPYEPSDMNVSSAGQKEKYNKLRGAVRSYLAEMNVQQNLYDDMLLIPPDKVRILSEESLGRYGLVKMANFKVGNPADHAGVSKAAGKE